MLLLLVLCWGLAHAIHGALSRAYGDGRAAVRSGVGRAGSALRAARGSESTGARFVGSAGLGLGYLISGVWRALSGSGRSLWLGGRDGWERGRRRALRRAARARVDRRRAATPAVDPAAPVDDTDCRPTDPGDEPASATPTPVGGDGAASSTNPTQPEPTIPPDRKDPTMSTPTRVVGEVAGMSGARQALAGFAASATMFLDVAERAKAEAASARGQAAALRQEAEALQASMAAGEVDAATLGEVAALQEQAAGLESAAAELERAAAKVEQAADGLSASSARASSGLQSRHGLAEEAIKSTSAPASTAFYKG